MASLDSIMIQGIRSFGPREQDRGVLKLISPLTLILGQNGCGKTTIIEALKYATTGEMPPGSNRGQSFVHDPTIAHETSIKAQVKLVFSNVKNEKMIAQRIFEGTKKAKTITIKSLASTLTTTSPGGESRSISKKCIDMEAEMFLALGVTKPILNYVIFCHQEESNWPLDEGKKLKERFDAIFDATEYLKCIKNMKDHVKGLRNKVSVKKEEVDSSFKDHTEAELLKKEISTQGTRLSVSEDKVAKCKRDRDDTVQELRKLQKIEKEVSGLEADKTKHETLLGELRKNVITLEKNLQRPGCLQVSDKVTGQELDEMMEQMASSVSQRRRDAEQDQSRLDDVQRKTDQIKEAEGRLNVQLGKLELAEENFKKLRHERDKMVAELYARHGREGPPLPAELADKDVRVAGAFIQDALKKAEAKQRRVASEVSCAVDKAQADVDAVRDEKTKLESQKDFKRSQLTANYAEVRVIQEKLDAARGSSAKLKELDAKLKKIEVKLEAAKSSLDLEEMNAQLKRDDEKLTSLEADIRALEAEKDSVLANMSVRKELSIHEENLQKKEGEIKRLMNKNADAFETLNMADVPRDKLSHHLDAKCRTLQTAANKKDAELKRLQRTVNSQEVKQRYQQTQLDQLKAALAEDQRELDATLHGADLEVELAELNAHAADVEKQHSSLVSMQVMYSRYVEKLEREQPCPLCHRDFDSADEAAELVAELRRKMDGVPREVAEAEERKRLAKERHDDLLTLRPRQENAIRLRDNEIPATHVQLEEANVQLSELQQQHTHLQCQAQEAEKCRRLADELRADVGRIDDRERDVRRTRDEVERLRAALPSRHSKRTADQVGGELEARRAEADVLRASRRRNEAQLRQHRDEVAQLSDERNGVSGERLRLEKLQADRSQLERRIDELTTANDALRVESVSLEANAVQLESRMLEAAARREQVAADGRQREEAERNHAEQVRVEVARFQSANDALLAHVRDNKAQELLRVRQKLRAIREEAREDAAVIARLRDRIDQTREALNSQESRQRDLQDHKQLRGQRHEEMELAKRIKELDSQLDGYDTHSIKEVRRRHEVEHSRVTEAIFSEEGAQKQIRELVRTRTAKLSQRQFCQAEAIYREHSLELACHSLAVRDLQTYAKALDDAILRFHSKRMERINSIVRELWRETYCGNDIDYIEIRTDQCASGDGAQRRTNYNYRVVMVKQAAQLEMRGRCSAGQKVLASLIIRLALAETFGVQCGVMALDEPTTNLDRENILRLASALQDIVRKRAVQKNFQLLVITHDEEFLTVLSRLDYVDRYYEVSRSDSGLSRITKHGTSGR